MKPFEAPWGNYLLDNLVETTAPESVSWLPSTPAWFVVFAIGIAYFLLSLYRRWLAYQRDAYRREALQWLMEFEQNKNQGSYRQLPVLLKKVAIQAFGRDQVAELYGDEWNKWLDQRCESSRFVEQCPNALYQLAYAKSVDIGDTEFEKLLDQIKKWIKEHRWEND